MSVIVHCPKASNPSPIGSDAVRIYEPDRSSEGASVIAGLLPIGGVLRMYAAVIGLLGLLNCVSVYRQATELSIRAFCGGD